MEVKFGDIWKIGDHTIRCADLEQKMFPFRGALLPDVVYSDPPWGPGNASYWRHQMDAKAVIDYDRFLEASVRAATQNPKAPVFVEMGLRWEDQIKRHMEAANYRQQLRWPIVYYGDKPVGLHCYVTGAVSSALIAQIKALKVVGMDDKYTPTECLKIFPKGSVVCDPCVGKGCTPITAALLGHRFVGSELIPKRLAYTLGRLEKIFKAPAVKVG